MRRRPDRRWVAASVLAIVASAGCADSGDEGDRAVEPSAPTTSTTASSTTASSTTGTSTTGPSTTGVERPTESSVVVDTDLALDDLIALAFLLSTDVEVRAITISGTGEVRCPQGLAVISGLLALTGDDEIPVACGRSTPLVGSREFPVGWRDAADSGWGLTLGPVGASDVAAVPLLREALADGEATLLTLGPLTNVADALRADPTLVEQIVAVVMMGGSVDAGGNVFEPGLDAEYSEWNVYVDPTAADEVIAAGVPVVMVGLDATNRVPVTIDFVERLAVNRHTAAAELVHRLLEQNSLVYSGEAYFWDPLAAAAIVDRSVIATASMSIDVVTDNGPESGRTVHDEGGTSIDVAVDADGTALEALLIRGLDGLSPSDAIIEPAPPVGVATVRFVGGACSYDGPASVSPGPMRFRSDGDGQAAGAVVAHLTGEVTVDELLEWVAANPGSQPPGVDVVQFVPAGGEAFLDVLPGTTAVACADLDNNLVSAGTFLVE